MLKLYTGHNSICTQKAFITLDEKGLPFETQYVDLFRNEQFQPWYLAVNPKGVVPALDHDGRVVTESTLICEYLDDMFPGRRLVPQDPHARSLMRQWSKRVDEYLFDATRELSFSAMFRERMRNMTAEEREGRYRNTGDPIKRDRLKSTYEFGAASPYVFQGVGAFEMAFKSMEKELEALGGPWLLGTDLTLADINMMPFVARLHYLNLLDLWLPERSLVQRWFDRVRDLPSFKRNVVDKLSQGDYEAMHQFGTIIRDQVREQRNSYLAQFA